MSFAEQLQIGEPVRVKCARRYHFQKIKYPNNLAHIHFKQYRAAVRDLASVLLVLVKWDYDQFCEFQGAIADVVTAICKPKKPYSTGQMRAALKTLENENYLLIPNTVNREEKLAKTYTFKPDFKALTEPLAAAVIEPAAGTGEPEPPGPLAEQPGNLAEPEQPGNLAEPEPPAEPAPVPGQAEQPGPVCDSSLLREKIAMFKVTEANNPERDRNRAFNIDRKPETIPPRVCGDNIAKTEKGRTAKNRTKPAIPKIRAKQINRDLCKSQRGIVHWFARCSDIRSETEAAILTGLLVSNWDHDFIAQRLRTWLQLSKPEKSFCIRQLVKILRDLRQAGPVSCPPLADVGQLPDPRPADTGPPPGEDRRRFLDALLFGGDWAGPGQEFIKRFRQAEPADQDRLIEQFNRAGFEIVDR